MCSLFNFCCIAISRSRRPPPNNSKLLSASSCRLRKLLLNTEYTVLQQKAKNTIHIKIVDDPATPTTAKLQPDWRFGDGTLICLIVTITRYDPAIHKAKHTMYQKIIIRAQISVNPIENRVVRLRKFGRQQQHVVSVPLPEVSEGVGLMEILNIRTMNATVLMSSNETPEMNKHSIIYAHQNL